jgi:Zn-dependent membrane protease YugP
MRPATPSSIRITTSPSSCGRSCIPLLEERRFLSAGELAGAREVLKAAALTYVASTAMAAMQLLRMFLLRQSRD